ncbi:xylulokinase [Siculibacillus lacustris]|uniref:Xylulose kinase n=1 Tax=Siculibacillus lacustris TaxID=1549641 RepID=A0A4Q9VFP9_9HYPH|nr:xylulokinase [Siculibacillus lacustris]TBW33574.1 xylulokinase [Siculibacillus lacustris]
MRCFLGLDIGTSAVKAILVDETGGARAEASSPLALSRPRPGWSEQHPDAWWQAVEATLDALAAAAPADLSAVAAIGLSGQMHGAVLLGADDRPLRAAILWNDGRATREARTLAARGDELAGRLGVRAMPGLTAPKLLWLAVHEPEVFAALRTLLLPKDWIRLKLTGERVTDTSDAAGTWLLDEARRDWDPEALDAVGLARDRLPRLVEGTDVSGRLRAEVAARWGMRPGIPVAGGAGDSPAGAIGLGVVDEGTALLNLGTSALLLAPTGAYRPNAAHLVHAFCHGLPGRWYQMAAMLNGASALAWAAGLVGREVGDLVAEIEARDAPPADLLFLPYLSGERTPHDDPWARGVLFGLDPTTSPADVGRAVMEGVAFTFADAVAALAAAGTDIRRVDAIGGGTRSRLWARILAAVMNVPVVRRKGGDKGPAFGAARLARLCLGEDRIADVCVSPPVDAVAEPEPDLVAAYGERVERFRRLYGAVKGEFSPRRN